MIEKVARAITKQALKDAGVYEKLDHIKKITMVEENWRTSLNMARIAMETMREPTGEMMESGDEATCSCRECECQPHLIYKSMIREALK